MYTGRFGMGEDLGIGNAIQLSDFNQPAKTRCMDMVQLSGVSAVCMVQVSQA